MRFSLVQQQLLSAMPMKATQNQLWHCSRMENHLDLPPLVKTATHLYLCKKITLLSSVAMLSMLPCQTTFPQKLSSMWNVSPLYWILFSINKQFPYPVGPSEVHIGGPDLMLAGQAGGYECVSSSSNPPAEIRWQVTDHQGEDAAHLIQVGIWVREIHSHE